MYTYVWQYWETFPVIDFQDYGDNFDGLTWEDINSNGNIDLNIILELKLSATIYCNSFRKATLCYQA